MQKGHDQTQMYKQRRDFLTLSKLCQGFISQGERRLCGLTDTYKTTRILTTNVTKDVLTSTKVLALLRQWVFPSNKIECRGTEGKILGGISSWCIIALVAYCFNIAAHQAVFQVHCLQPWKNSQVLLLLQCCVVD